MKKLILLGTAVVIVSTFAAPLYGQKRSKLGRVCGDPTAPCKVRDSFQPFDLPFDFGRGNVLAESEWFYGIVLKSRKLDNYDADCNKPEFPEAERLKAQELFPKNQVFTLNCWETGTNYYNGVNSQSLFMGVYAGRTKAEADAFLKKVKQTGKYLGVKVRRMRVGVNGT
jgi:hypothetical protein